MILRQAQEEDLNILAELAILLWPQHTAAQMREDLSLIIKKPETAFFLTFDGSRAIGFAQCQLRHDYVEGTESSPVGYLEGIYVAEDCRGQGIAKMLLAACESWAKSMGCSEFASDCELENLQSLHFHLRVGFVEAGRIICFSKRL